MSEPTRDDVAGYVDEAGALAVDVTAHVRECLIRDYPGIDTRKIRRNSHEYILLDYLLDDLESYG